MVLLVTGWHGVGVAPRQGMRRVWTRVRKRGTGRIHRQGKQAAGVWRCARDPEEQEDRESHRQRRQTAGVWQGASYPEGQDGRNHW